MESSPNLEPNSQDSAQHNLLVQVKKSIFTFKTSKRGDAFGFFCKFRYFSHQNNIFYILIINNKFVDNEDIADGNVIKILLNKSNCFLFIKFDSNSREIYREEDDEGITIIEIHENDILDTNIFFEIDLINEKNSENICLNSLVYLADCSDIQNPELSLRKITDIDSNYFEKGDKMGANELFVWSPIIKSDNYKLIGFQIRYNNDSNSKFLRIPESIINYYKNKISITIIYKTFELKLKLFGTGFVEDKKNICKMILRGKITELSEYINITEDERRNKYFAIKLKYVNKLEDLEFMFLDCTSLYSLPDLDLLDTSNVKSVRSMFNGCGNLTILSDISNWNTSNFEDMKFMFNYCISLEKLPDIGKWDINKVIDMGGLFNGCSSLKEIPDISKWRTSNVEDISFMFCECSLLKTLPDISKWDTKNVINIMHIFESCINLKKLPPDISKWKTDNMENFNSVFRNCSNLQELPDISKWKTEKVKCLSYMFDGCSSLITLPDISKWKTNNVVNICGMFRDCSSLISIPDISNWSLDKVREIKSLFKGCSILSSMPDISKWKLNLDQILSMNNLFNGCSSLLYLPDISIWDTKNVINMKNLFKNCKSLIKLPDISKWNVNKVTDMSGLFSGCSSLIFLPRNINNWNLEKVEKMNEMFRFCSSLVCVPSFEKFKDNKVEKRKIFEQCSSLVLFKNKSYKSH